MSFEPIMLAGPTAVGKSDVAIELAELCDGEIISVDSMQVYRGLDVGTAKPGPEERARIPHHLLDVVELTDSFDAARFVALVNPLIAEIKARGHVPILCGGTGLYFKAWRSGLGTAPAPDPTLRAELESLPLEVLLDELARRDWLTFDEIDIKNPRRVVRAVEVLRLTGRPFSEQRAEWPESGVSLVGRSFGIDRPRELLVQRIEQRVDAMFSRGLIEETEALMNVGLAQNRTAMQAIGYRQVVEFLEGKRGRRDAIEQVKIRTRQFAKRQGTWFRGQMDLVWLEFGSDDAPHVIARRIKAAIEKAA